MDVSRKKIAAEVEGEMAGLDVSAERKKEIVERRLRSEINRGVQTIQYQVGQTDEMCIRDRRKT